MPKFRRRTKRRIEALLSAFPDISATISKVRCKGENTIVWVKTTMGIYHAEDAKTLSALEKALWQAQSQSNLCY